MPIYDICPVAKPTMTQRDKWLKPPRKPVAQYRAFKDWVGVYKVQLPTEGASIVFVLPMPPSWSKAKKKRMAGKPHQQKPDTSNLLKALEDAIYADDSKIWQYSGLMKIWGYEGQIWINQSQKEVSHGIQEQDLSDNDYG